MNNIFIETGFETGQDLLSRLHRLRPLLSSSQSQAKRVKVLVIDSIAHIFRDLLQNKDSRSTLGNKEVNERTALLFEISSLLRAYADEYKILILITNQVMDAFESKSNGKGLACSSSVDNVGHTGGMKLVSSGREVTPALGLAWAHCIHNRIFLSKSSYTFMGGPSESMKAAVSAKMTKFAPFSPELRHMLVVFSPFLPQNRCGCIVEAVGVKGVLPCDEEKHKILKEIDEQPTAA